MGGFSAQVQNSQTGQPSSKGGTSGEVDPGFNIPSGNVSSQPPQPLDGIQNGYFAQPPHPMGKGGAQTNSATSGQQRMGSPNPYPNTIGMGDNQPNQPMPQAGKGKGA